MNERDSQLSDTGAKRREAMLGDLIVEMRTHHAHRRVRRRAAVVGAVGLALLAAAIAIALPRQTPTPPAPQMATSPPSESVSPELSPAPEPDQRRAVRTILVQTARAAADRHIVRTTEHPGVLLTDEELLATLESIGRPTGLVRTQGRVWLTASVTDEDRKNRPGL